MAILWIITAGFVICLGLAGGVLVHSLRRALHSEDATRVDSVNQADHISK